MCLGNIFNMALAIFPALMSFFFSYVPCMLPPPSLKLPGVCVSLSSSPWPRLFGCSSFPVSKFVSLQVFSAERVPFLFHPTFFEDEPRNSGKTNSLRQRSCLTGHAACMGGGGGGAGSQLAGVFLVPSHKERFSCELSSHPVTLLAQSAQVPSARSLPLFSL